MSAVETLVSPTPYATADRSAARLKKRLLPAARIDLVCSNGAKRQRIENYIAHQFAEKHHAMVDHFLPHLLELRGESGICAALGFGAAHQSTLFLEKYLDRKIEEELSLREGVLVHRNSIVEIGNLVATHRGSSQLLFTVMTSILHRAGFRWVVFTATRKVANIIAKSHFTPHRLCSADPRRLEDSGASWGDYYQHDPQVMVGDLAVTARQTEDHPLLQATVDYFKSDIERFTELVLWNYSRQELCCENAS